MRLDYFGDATVSDYFFIAVQRHRIAGIVGSMTGIPGIALSYAPYRHVWIDSIYGY
jgi:hypothetical protein